MAGRSLGFDGGNWNEERWLIDATRLCRISRQEPNSTFESWYNSSSRRENTDRTGFRQGTGRNRVDFGWTRRGNRKDESGPTDAIRLDQFSIEIPDEDKV